MRDKDVNRFSKHDLFEPQHAIITMASPGAYYAEIGEFTNGQLGPLRPLGVEEAVKLGSILLNKTTRIEIGRIPRNLFYMSYNAGRYDLVWYTPPQVRKLYFKKELKIESGQVPLPTLIWKYKNKTLYLYACKDQVPNDTSHLFKAPFHNMHGNNDVCLGSGDKFIVPEDPSVKRVMQSVETAFFKSYFTTMHTNTIKGNLNVLMKDLVAKKYKEFPLEFLIDTKQRLGHIYEEGNYYNYSSDDDLSDDWDDQEDTNEDTDDEELTDDDR